jgi:hypothetical protein
MDLFKKALSKFSNRILLVLVVVFGILASRSLIFQSGYFNMHDDLQMMRQLEMEKCFLDGQIPCRWVPDMGYGYGFPLFNFYPPLPYLIGEMFRVVGFSFVTTVKLTFALALVISGISMYYLAKEFFGPLGGFLSGVFYVWAPYRAVDIYVRGAMNESWTFVFFPLLFLFSFRLITSKRADELKYIVALALSYAGLLLSHNLMVLIFTPALVAWCLLLMWTRRRWNKLFSLAMAAAWAVGLSSFFTIPAVFENKFTQVRSQLTGYYDYTAHFASLNQLLFSRFWGYGPSVWMEADGMSFQIGILHWLLSTAIFLAIMLKSLSRGFSFGSFIASDRLVVSTFVFLLGWFSAYMIHLKSLWIYRLVPILGFIQFPWRFLTIVVFAMSFLIGLTPHLFDTPRTLLGKVAKSVKIVFFVGLLEILLVVSNWHYFEPEGGRMGSLTDEEKFSGVAWELQQTAGIYDYLPITAKEAPRGPQTSLAEVMEGKAFIKSFSQGTNWGKFYVDVEEDSKIRIGIFSFPGWKVFYCDGREKKDEIPTFVPDEERWGRMWINLPRGNYQLCVEFLDTPVRKVSNVLSLLSWLMLFVIYLRLVKSSGPRYER